MRFFTNGLPKRTVWTHATIEMEPNDHPHHRVRHVPGDAEDVVHSLLDVPAAIEGALKRSRIKIDRSQEYRRQQ